MNNTIKSSLSVCISLLTLLLIPYVASAQGKLYGVTPSGGSGSAGVLFEYDLTSGTSTSLYDFQYGTGGGTNPQSTLIKASNGKIYGTAYYGGANGQGTIFEFDPVTHAMTTKFDFGGGTAGKNPIKGMILAPDGKLYGITLTGGASDFGVIYEFNPSTGTCTNKVEFAGIAGGSRGKFPYAGLKLNANGILYGSTAFGGAHNDGVLFQYDPVNNTYLVLYDFDTVFPYNGTSPMADVVFASNGKMYGTTRYGGVNDQGTLFEYDLTTSTLTKKVDMAASVSGNNINGPFGNLVEVSAGRLLGVSMNGGIGGEGAMFEFLTATSALTKLVDLSSATTGAHPSGGLTVDPAGNVYGTTYDGGPNGFGTVFKYSSTNNFTKVFDFSSTGTFPGADPTYSELLYLQSQTITFGALSASTYGAAPFNLTATSSSGLSVSYTSSNTAVATVSGNTVTIIAPGSTNITASQAGNATYAAASNVVQALTVNKANQTITFGALTPVNFGAAPFTIAASASSTLTVSFTSSNTNVATVSGNTITVVGAGSTTITANQSGNANYNAATAVPQTLVVNKINQTTTFGALTPVTFGSAPFTLSATASSGLTVTYASSNTAVATVSGNTVTIVGGGATTITASQAGNANYNAAADVPQSLTVNKINQTITFGTLTASTFGSAPFSLTATSSSGLSVAYASSNTAVATVSGNTVTIIGAGTTTITASQGGNGNYNVATSVPQSLVVNMATQTITFGALSAATFGGANITLGATASSGFAVSYASSNAAVATVAGNTVTIVGVGTTTITASQGGNGNYTAATSVPQSLVVNMATQTITFGTLSAATFGGANITLGATASSGLTVAYASSNNAVATAAGNTVTIVGVGTTTITASQGGNGNYTAATSVPQSLAVNKANQTIAFGALSAATFGGANITLGATASSGLAVSYASSNSAVATVTGNTVTIVGAGTTTITASQGGNGNYNAATSVPQSLVVNKVTQTITFGALSAATFGGANMTLGATASSGLAVAYASSNTGVATVAGNTVTIVGAGTTTITASQGGNANYLLATDVPQSLLVNKAPQTITFAALATVASPSSPITLGATASSGLTLSYSSSNASVATVSGNTLTILGAGTSIITASQGGDTNYAAGADVPQTLTVTGKSSQTITFNTFGAVSFGASPVTLTATASSGLAVAYASSNTSVATVSGNKVTIVGVGQTSITASQPGNATFNAAADLAQTLTVTKGGQTISFASLASKTFGDATFDLTAAATSGLGVAYLTSNAAVATVSGNKITITGAGTVNIVASQVGNSLYNAATDVSQTLTVAKANQLISFTTVADTPQSAGSITLTATSNSGLEVAISSSDANVTTVAANKATIVGAGKVTFKASQSGNSNYNAAADVSQTICIQPNKPTITSSLTNPEAPVLTSSSGTANQWFLNAAIVTGATSPTYTPSKAGIYTTQVAISGCASPMSEGVPIVVTGLEIERSFGLYPNPAQDEVRLSTRKNVEVSVQIVNTLGQPMKQVLSVDGGEIEIDIRDLSAGTYLLKALQGERQQTIHFVKK